MVGFKRANRSNTILLRRLALSSHARRPILWQTRDAGTCLTARFLKFLDDLTISPPPDGVRKKREDDDDPERSRKIGDEHAAKAATR